MERFILALVAAMACMPTLAQWEVRETRHPSLGPIVAAFPRDAFTTPVGHLQVSSRVFVSCERDSGKIAIELAHATAPDDPGGLQPKTIPQLMCNRASNKMLIRDEILARWAISDIGDVLARGFQPAALRRCASIGVVQEVALPKGWPAQAARVEFEIAPNAPELDAVFVACGEVSWREARTVASGKTNVRARPTVDSGVVAQLHPGSVLVAQPAGGDWWRVRPSRGTAFDGYIRRDRLVFR